MEREIVRRITGDESERNLNGTRVLVYRYEDDPEGYLRFALVKRFSEDDINVFVRREIDATRERIEDLEEGKRDADKDRHSRPPAKSTIAQRRKDMERLLGPLREKLKVLEGEVVYPIVITREEDEITGSNLSLSRRESSWWSYIKDKREILELDPEDIQFLLKAFLVRYNLKVEPSRKTELSKEWDEIREGLSERRKKIEKGKLSEKRDLTPYVVDITNHLT